MILNEQFDWPIPDNVTLNSSGYSPNCTYGCMDPAATNYDPEATCPGAPNGVTFNGVIAYGPFVCEYNFSCENIEEHFETLHYLAIVNNEWYGIDHPDPDSGFPSMSPEDMFEYMCGPDPCNNWDPTAHNNYGGPTTGLCGTSNVNLNPGQYCPACYNGYIFNNNGTGAQDGVSMCTCCCPTANEILGCTDPVALNYDSYATVDDGSCEYPVIEGCTDPDALNYNPEAEIDDGSCEYPIFFCCEIDAANFGQDADGNQVENPEEYILQNGPQGELCDNSICIYPIEGCTDPDALNYDPEAEVDDGSCEYPPCYEFYQFSEEDQNGVCNWYYTIGQYDLKNPDFITLFELIDYGECCPPPTEGCTDEEALNYDPNAQIDDGSCEYPGECDEFNALSQNDQDNICNWVYSNFNNEADINQAAFDSIMELTNYGECCPDPPPKFKCTLITGWGSAEGTVIGTCEEVPPYECGDEVCHDTLDACEAAGCGPTDCWSEESFMVYDTFGGFDNFCENTCDTSTSPLCECCECDEEELLNHVLSLGYDYETTNEPYDQNIYHFCTKCSTSYASSGAYSDVMCHCCPQIRYSCAPNYQPDGSVEGTACIGDPDGPYESGAECQEALYGGECHITYNCLAGWGANAGSSTCAPVSGQGGEFETFQECEDSGCGDPTPDGPCVEYYQASPLLRSQCCHLFSQGVFYDMSPPFTQANYPNDWGMVAANPCNFNPECCPAGMPVVPGTDTADPASKKLQVTPKGKETISLPTLKETLQKRAGIK